MIRNPQPGQRVIAPGGRPGEVVEVRRPVGKGPTRVLVRLDVEQVPTATGGTAPGQTTRLFGAADLDAETRPLQRVRRTSEGYRRT